MDIKVNASLNQGINAIAEIGNIKEIPVGPDIYEGLYEITAPSTDDLVLPSKDKLMADDVTIKANHEIEDTLIQNSSIDEYVNDRVTEVKYYGFVKTNIKKIYLPNVTKVENSAFDGINDSLVEEIYIPNCTTCGATTFARNPNLKIVDCGKVKVNTNGRFNYCPKLTTIIARRTDGLMAPSGADIISGPFAPDGTGGYVYVPQALLSQYRANESWQLHANVLEFRPIEGSEYELEEL